MKNIDLIKTYIRSARSFAQHIPSAKERKLKLTMLNNIENSWFYNETPNKRDGHTVFDFWYIGYDLPTDRKYPNKNADRYLKPIDIGVFVKLPIVGFDFKPSIIVFINGKWTEVPEFTAKWYAGELTHDDGTPFNYEEIDLCLRRTCRLLRTHTYWEGHCLGALYAMLQHARKRGQSGMDMFKRSMSIQESRLTKHFGYLTVEQYKFAHKHGSNVFLLDTLPDDSETPFIMPIEAHRDRINAYRSYLENRNYMYWSENKDWRNDYYHRLKRSEFYMQMPVETWLNDDRREALLQLSDEQFLEIIVDIEDLYDYDPLFDRVHTNAYMTHTFYPSRDWDVCNHFNYHATVPKRETA